MARYFIQFSFDGTLYHGWQIQDNANTVQAEVNAALSAVLGENVCCTGCGRTDTGVHAADFYAHFDTGSLSAYSGDFVFKLNGCLPADIAVHRVIRVGDSANARFDAVSRSYRYLIVTKKDVFARLACFHYGTLNLEAMHNCTRLLVAHRDFSCFSKSHTQTKTNDCHITDAKWITIGDKLEFQITANRFLRGMVRAIVGTLLMVGEEKIGEDGFSAILDGKDRSDAGFSVPAKGLFLDKVAYPRNYFDESSIIP